MQCWGCLLVWYKGGVAASGAPRCSAITRKCVRVPGKMYRVGGGVAEVAYSRTPLQRKSPQHKYNSYVDIGRLVVWYAYRDTLMLIYICTYIPTNTLYFTHTQSFARMNDRKENGEPSRCCCCLRGWMARWMIGVKRYYLYIIRSVKKKKCSAEWKRWMIVANFEIWRIRSSFCFHIRPRQLLFVSKVNLKLRS